MIERYNFYWNSDEGEQELADDGEYVLFTDHQEIVGELVMVLKNLAEICGEANIPMTSTKAVARMSCFLARLDEAKEAIKKAEEK